MSTQHTPGPWEAPHDDSPYWLQGAHIPIIAPDGALVAYATPNRFKGLKANARLITAAPELLEMAYATLSYCQDNSRSGRRRQAILNDVRAAIAKAVP